MPSMSRSFEVFHVSGVNLDVSDSSKLKDKAIFLSARVLWQQENLSGQYQPRERGSLQVRLSALK